MRSGVRSYFYALTKSLQYAFFSLLSKYSFISNTQHNTTKMKVLIVIALSLLGLVLASEWVPIPGGGYRPRHCVHVLDEEGAQVYHPTPDHMFIKYANGTRKELPPCKEAMKQERQLRQGWTAYAVYNTQKELSSFTGQWIVPQPPQAIANQNIYLLMGMENYYYDVQAGAYKVETIIEPVLQWGHSMAGGGSYWSIASWYVGSGPVVVSTAKKVQPNDVILGTLFLNKNNTWSVQAVDKTTGVSSNIVVTTGTAEPVATVTYQTYGMENCQDYPPGKVRFSNLAVLDGASKPLQPKWQPVVITQCDEAVNVISSSIVDIVF